MLRFSPLRRGAAPSCALAAALAIAVTGAFAGCGDLIIPAQPDGGGDDGGLGGEGGQGDDGGMPGDGSADALADGADTGPVVLDCNADTGVDHPVHLGCTGLYTDFNKKTISPSAIPFDPGLHLWSDGADKSRYIYLPPGTKIDTTNLNEWTFPVGTKFWKEFRLIGRPVETRFLQKLGPQTWFRTTYEWNDQGTQALELVGGRLNVRGLGYEIPSTDVCATCHGGREDFVLGFEIVSLSTSLATGLTMDQLISKGLLSANPAVKPVIPGDQLTVDAFGFLHSNCGNACHNRSPGAFAGATGLFMRLDVDATGALTADRTQTDLWKTSVGVPSTFQPQGVPPGTFLRIKAHDPTTSAIPYRDGRRDGVVQMPPLATHLVDFADVAKLNSWINSLP